MGHTRLGSIPKTRLWRQVVADVASSLASAESLTETVIADIARRSLLAAQAGLGSAMSDEGFAYTVYLLMRVTLASRQSNWEENLTGLGLVLPKDPTAFDFAAAFHEAVDTHLSERAWSTDFSEIAQSAAGEALVSFVGKYSDSLFGSRTDYLRSSVRELSTKTGFSILGQHFFSSFMARFLDFHLSRVTASQVGPDRILEAAVVGLFNEKLRLHCYETSRVVRDFCGQWYSKTEHLEGITPENASRFLAVALDKLNRELSKQVVENA
jgi:hypothetical protein